METNIDKNADEYIDIHHNSGATHKFLGMLTLYIVVGLMILGIL